MQYLPTFLAIAICVVQANAALTTVPGLPYPLAPQGMRWIGSVTPGSRNVTLYGTVDKIISQLDDLKLRPEEEWPLSTEAEEKSVLNSTTLDTTSITKRSYVDVNCNIAGSPSEFPLSAVQIIWAITDLAGSCGSSAGTCVLMNSAACSAIYFCSSASSSSGTGCLGAGLLGSTIMSCMTPGYTSVIGQAFDDRGWSVVIGSAC